MDELPPLLPPVEAPALRPPAMSLAARLLNVFAVPGEVFEDVKASIPSNANWLVPSLMFLVVGCVGAWLIFSQPAIQQQQREMTAQMLQKMVDKGIMKQEQVDQALDNSSVGSKFGGYFAPLFGAFVSPIWWALVLWLVGTQVFKAKFEFIKALEVSGLANAIAVLGEVVRILLVVGLGDMLASPSPALLVKHTDPQNPSFALLTVLNVTTIWMLGVRSVGLARMAGVPLGRAAVWIFGVWIAGTMLLVGFGLAMKSVLGL